MLFKNCAKCQFSFCCGLIYQWKSCKNDLNLIKFTKNFWIKRVVKLEVEKNSQTAYNLEWKEYKTVLNRHMCHVCSVLSSHRYSLIQPIENSADLFPQEKRIKNIYSTCICREFNNKKSVL
jgi:hypothetical protein